MISGWNPLDFTGQICQISGWNLVDFMKSLVIAPTLHSSNWRVFAETLAFIICVDFTGEIWVKSGGFHEILGHSPHPAFIKLKSFCWNTCFYNLGGFHRWNLGEMCQISWVKSGGFHEILGHSPHPAFIKLKSFFWNTCFYNFGWISQVKSGWNPPDFTGEIHQISGWNLVDFKGEIPHPAFIKLKSFCWNTCFYNLGGFHRWYLGEIRRISRISWWNPPDFMKSVWNPPDFMKSAGFHGMWAFAWWSSIGLSFERPNNVKDRGPPFKTDTGIILWKGICQTESSDTAYMKHSN